MTNGPIIDSSVPSHAAAADAQASSGALAASFRHCHRVTRRGARHFYYGLKLTPEPKRTAIYVVYAFMRACDDLADGVDPPRNAQELEAGLARVEAFRRQMRQAVDPAQPLPAGPIWPALRRVVGDYGIDRSRFEAMLNGQRSDLVATRYATFDDLYAYCFKVASVVGLACLDIWGHDGAPGVPKLAEYRGIAFQLTHVLRDLMEDARRDRIYLPQEDLDRFGVAPDDLVHGLGGQPFERLMVFQIERARSYYQMSEPLERHIDPSCRATSWAMTQIYRRLLEQIAPNPRQVLTRRVRLSSLSKLAIAAQATLKRTWQ